MQKLTKLKWIIFVSVLTVAALAATNISPAVYAVAPVADGAALFSARCAKCHGADGKGVAKYKKKGQKDFTDKQWQKSKSDAQITGAINNGKGEVMPAWKSKLSADDIKALVSQIRAFGK